MGGTYLYARTARQAPLEPDEGTTDFVSERGLALLVDARAAREDAATVGPGGSCGGCVVASGVGEGHFECVFVCIDVLVCFCLFG